MRVYLDNGATTQVDEKVVKAMLAYFTEKYGNANSVHSKGAEAKMGLDDSRKTIARHLGCRFDEIIFTSGGTESNNLALRGVMKSIGKGKNEIITSVIEHPAILETCRDLEREGCKTHYLNVNDDGFISLDELKKLINPKTAIVSVMHANNEIGTINNIDEIGKICHENKVLFHTDAVQSFCKMKINLEDIDLLSASSHKIHGPKGVGLLFVKRGTPIKEVNTGGGQEFGLRSGTINVSGIAGFAEAIRLFRSEDVKRMTKLRDKLINGILEIPGTKLNGAVKERICHNVNVSFKGCEGEAVGAYLDSKGICSSTGSACASLSLEPSHVLKAIGLSGDYINGSLRLTLSKLTTDEEISYVLEVLPEIIKKVRKISGYKGDL